MVSSLSPEEIRQAKLNNPKARDRDLAAQLGISEAQLVAAHLGHGVTAINPHPDALMPAVSKLGEVMALTRNESAVHERVGTYGKYHSGAHASMVLGLEIDLRIFAKHWVSGYAVEVETDRGTRRSLQVFDAAGDAVHKIYLRDGSEHDQWDAVVKELAVDAADPALAVEDRKPTEPAKENAAKRDVLLQEWARMTDTHQFLRLTSKLGMNRLGAYRLVEGGRWVRRVENTSVETLFNVISTEEQEVILFVGNPGNIQIHWGPLENIKIMGPWLNVMDEKFSLHLRNDHIAEVYVVEKPTKRGAAFSLEAFDAEGMLIFQVFGRKVDQDDPMPQWADMLANLPSLKAEEPV